MRPKIQFAVAALLLAFGLADAQQARKSPRIGYVSGTGTVSNQGPYVEALRQGLRELGYIDGQNIEVEFRGAEGRLETIPLVVKELVQRKVDVLVLPLILGIRSAQQLTKTIPIVMVTQVDPVASGLVASLARPGGNITGLATLQRELSGKRIELLSEIIPKLLRIGVLRDGHDPVAELGFADYERAARPLKIRLHSLEVYGSNPDLEGAITKAVKLNLNALITITNTPLFRNAKRVAELAIKHRLPSMYEGSSWIEQGGLLSYSANDLELFRRAAVYVDKILKGTSPAELPVEQPTKFDFVINLKAAKQIGLTIPPQVLARADRVIK